MARTSWFAALPALLLVLASSADAGTAAATSMDDEDATRPWRLTATSGFEIDRGIFGNTDQTNIPLVLRLEYGGWALGFATSALQIDGPAAVGRISIGRASADRVDQFLANNPGVSVTDLVQVEPADDWGHGDSMVTLSYAWYDPDSWLPFVEFSAGLKIPTASTRKQHGTGKFDYLLQVDFAQSFGRWTPFGTVGYRLNGSSYQPPILRLTQAAIDGGVMTATGASFAVPEPIRIRDTAQTSVGFNYRAADSLFEHASGPAALNVGLSYDWQQNAVAGVSDTHELVPFLTLEWSRNVQIGPYLVVGLSKSAPDIGFAAQITVSY